MAPIAGSTLQEGLPDDDDNEEAFRYPSDDEESPQEPTAEVAAESDDEEFSYPVAEEDPPPRLERTSPVVSPLEVEVEEAKPSPPEILHQDIEQRNERQQSHSSERSHPPAHATAAQLEALYSAGLSGDLDKLRTLLEAATSSGDFETFALVNDASPRTGLTVVHAAASRGRLNVLEWCTWTLDVNLYYEGGTNSVQ